MMRALLLSLAALIPALAAADELEAIESRLDRSAVSRGSFEQRKHIAGFDLPLRSAGSYVYSRELGVLWTLHEPYEVSYRFTPAGNDERGADGRWQPMAGGETGADLVRELTRALLAGDLALLRRHFEIGAVIDAGGWTLDLVPLDAAWKRVFATARLAGDRRVRRLSLVEAGGDHTELELQHIDDAALSDTERAALQRD